MDDFRERKRRGERITALTAYDYPTARLLDESGIDVILVGDSLGMVVLGYDDTTEVTLPEMIHHTKAAARGVKRALLVADLPIHTYNDPAHAVATARALMAAGAQAVKLEGGVSHVPQIEAIVADGIAVMGHIGMLPQSVREEGGYKVKGRTQSEAEALVRDGLAVEKAGVFSVVLEIVNPEAARQITKALEIPTIGIGSGEHCDGQILVTHDLIGLFPWFTPKFVSPEARVAEEIRRATHAFIRRTKQ
ncbi:MAG TPA: 3-methyl-2-oxobutanoate hydroxymethyltransferase [Chthoniobacterales bacterium]|nr:3-methyl-2-oxobutanoate hydroxymethyltransferase [Chthoniobacterales bacterium]